jgi:hypothetical protein
MNGDFADKSSTCNLILKVLAVLAQICCLPASSRILVTSGATPSDPRRSHGTGEHSEAPRREILGYKGRFIRHYSDVITAMRAEAGAEPGPAHRSCEHLRLILIISGSGSGEFGAELTCLASAPPSINLNNSSSRITSEQTNALRSLPA